MPLFHTPNKTKANPKTKSQSEAEFFKREEEFGHKSKVSTMTLQSRANDDKNTNEQNQDTDLENFNDWNDQNYEEGELALDVYEDKENNIVIKSTIAGVRPEDIDISMNNDDMLTIRGKREHEEKIDRKNYFYKECYWGSFSRTIILPCEVKSSKITAKLKNGILTIKIPKARREKKVAVRVIEEI